jgi:polysaccharide biosynthesis protein PslH
VVAKSGGKFRAGKAMGSYKILIVSPVPTHPANSGNSARILRLAETLIEAGHDVHFAHITFQPGDAAAMRAFWGASFHEIAYRKPWNKHRCGPLPVPDRWMHPLIRRGWAHMTLDHYWDSRMAGPLRELHQRYGFDAVLANYVFFSGALEAFPSGVLKVLDTHDVFAGRHQLFRKAGLMPEWFYTTAAEERRGLRRADRVLAIQSQDRVFFEGLLRGTRPVQEVGHLLPPARHTPSAPSASVAFFGSGNVLNREALQGFLQVVWPELRRQVPDAVLKVFGSVSEGLAPVAGVQLRGRVGDPAEVYAEAALVINPMRVGTGLKIKSLEALAHGAALVASPVGLAGLEGAVGNGAFLAGKTSEWVKILAELLTQPRQLAAAQIKALQFAGDYHQRQSQTLFESFEC